MLRMQLEKTYGGDDRFKLGADFNVGFQDANKAGAHVTETMLEAMDKRELDEMKP